MSSPKLIFAVSIGAFAALTTGLMVASEVRAGASQDLPVAAALDADTIERAEAFEGSYKFVGGQKDREGLEAAIQTSMEAVSPMLRDLGSKRLREANPIPKTITIKVEGETAEILFDGKGHAVKLDGAPVRTRSRAGERVKISHRMRGAKLSEFVDGSGGDRRNDFVLSDDGQRLKLEVTISSGHLPVPVEYTLRFKRK